MKDDEIIYLCAFRYALGRRTYITDIVSSYLSSNVKNFSSLLLNKIRDEIEKAPSLGDDCDEVCWTSLKVCIDNELYLRTDKETMLNKSERCQRGLTERS